MSSTVLVTGGTGSFGRAVVPRLLDAGYVVRVYSRSEHAQADMRESLDSPGCRFLIGDIRDKERLRRAMDGCDWVIHAAALKRIEVGAYNPTEMVKTNVLGAINVVECAMDAGVGRVVALSTDKAFQPVSPYGQSKALMESIVLSANVSSRRTKFTVTRYGNVAWSRGSVWERFAHARKHGLAVRITDQECTRFHMTMDHAVDLVLNADDTVKPVIPDLPAYRLGDLVEAFDLEYKVVGLPAHEKKHESMDETRCSANARLLTVDELRKACNLP